MTYFRDLSRNDYWKTPRTELCVGWLSKDHPFPKGDVPNGLVKRLRAFLDTAVNQTRGLHGCDFCTDPLAYYEEEKLGSAELRVFARNGTVFAAPTLISHCITAHKYQPAQDFVEAVMQNPIPPDPGCLAQLKALGADITDWAALRTKYSGAF